ncbi:MAG: hypothetical protein ACK5X3_10315 [Pseudomonadota bacterium]
MATFNKFQAWAETMVEGANLGSDQFVIALTNSAPVATNSVIADITQISYTNLSSRNVTTTSSSQTGGTYTLVLQDLVMTASGSVGPFRYVVLFDDTLAGDPLVGWWDYGSSITMANGETFTVDFTGAAITLS